MARSSTVQRIIAGALLLGLCACGSDDPATGSTGDAGSASATGAANADDTAAESPAAPDDSGSEPAAGIPKQLCQFLKQEVPRLKARGSSVGALAGFAGDYASWVEKDANRKFASAQELDSITTTTCPEVREQVLAVLESPSFSSVLGS